MSTEIADEGLPRSFFFDGFNRVRNKGFSLFYITPSSQHFTNVPSVLVVMNIHPAVGQVLQLHNLLDDGTTTVMQDQEGGKSSRTPAAL